MALTKREPIPDKIRPFARLGFEYKINNVADNQFFGDCIFCQHKSKLYINKDDGRWDCKSCGRRGNIYTFMQECYKLWQSEIDNYNTQFDALAKDRGLPADVLKGAGIVFSGEEFVIPVRNLQSKICNFRLFNLFGPIPKGAKKHVVFGVPTIGIHIFGLEKLVVPGTSKHKVYICEGEWDTIALQYLLDREGEEGIVIGVPGVDIWKSEWTDYIRDRNIVICYDSGKDGERGAERLYKQLVNNVKSILYVKWPSGLPNGYDIRDFVTADCTFAELNTLLYDYKPQSVSEDELESVETKLLPHNSKERPSFADVQKVFSKNMHMTEDLWDGLRVVFATVLTVNIPRDPLWVHLVGPPGAGKTFTIMSTVDCVNTIARSTLSPKSLVSGFPATKDPSLIPKLNGKCLIIKDFTEIISMRREDKESIYGTLRGIYDGVVTAEYGNGVYRDYKSHFNVISGVTNKIYTDRSASLGERFLMMHIIKGNDFDSDNPIMSAIESVGKDDAINDEIVDIVSKFLDVAVDVNDLPIVDLCYKKRVKSLSQLVAILRASVERDLRRDRKLLQRAQPEMGTRLAKQLYKLLLGLSLIHVPAKVTDKELAIVTKVALDTCVGFNLEAFASLIDKPGQTMQELSNDCDLPLNTLRDQVEDLVHLNVFRTVKTITLNTGRKPYQYYVTDRLVEMWHGAGLKREGKGIISLSSLREQSETKIVTVKPIVTTSTIKIKVKRK